MSVPYLKINSMSYTSSVVTINLDYSYLRGGGSFSITGFSQSTQYYSVTNSYGSSITSTYSVGLSASTTYNLVFSFIKGPSINYPMNQPSLTGVTQGTYTTGGYAYNLGLQSVSPSVIVYEINRQLLNYTFTTS
jgi:hypothetical protein